ncbi:MAG: hypothetical protein AUK47_23535 [Deltaproteobacteria bacterium CG2_30_63_29]|nr:MAG: hypothetical protein AUK47_23535 [Deltaproteobacteria bacterium CG2_30_63_29]PIW01087.1 MAG: hypothetical protein COW42_05975 [Deltaproteobacteria bacterium CG17_big_fil_post_rev_8_21_14_2_50_63_7]PJB43915.1 MAG: hypothetical protein CO108_09535 [Deltaproteobacteria bacterium CG_4_9_14_3_um_filter_63_12]
MKLEEGAKYVIYGLEKDRLGELTFVDGHEVWPAGVNGWSATLDCTVEPYAEMSLNENVHFAHHIHKQAVVVKAS